MLKYSHGNKKCFSIQDEQRKTSSHNLHLISFFSFTIRILFMTTVISCLGCFVQIIVSNQALENGVFIAFLNTDKSKHIAYLIKKFRWLDLVYDIQQFMLAKFSTIIVKCQI